MDLRFYILRRVVVIIPTLFLLSFITFIFARPFLPVYGGFSNGYLSFLSLIFHGNFGTISTSIFTGPFIIGFELYFPVTVEIVILTVILTFVIGVPLGTYIGNSRIKETDFIARIFSLIFYSMPLFWIAIILEFTFGSGIGVFAGLFGNHAGLPVLGQGYSSTTNVPWISDQVSYPTHMLFFDSLLHGDFTLAYISFLHLIIPVIALTLSILAIIIRYIRAGVIDYSSNYIYKKCCCQRNRSKESCYVLFKAKWILPISYHNRTHNCISINWKPAFRVFLWNKGTWIPHC
jgi:ABC-type dipeptide/oligopeptide/nickel transport systems, permease components